MKEQPQIRLSESPLDISEDSPYANDRLNREPSCYLLTRLVTTIDGPCTIAIDAPWGYGKSTFLELWAKDLQKNEFSVIQVNAWETDYFSNPLLVIVGEMMKQFEDNDTSGVFKNIELSQLKECFPKIFSIAPKIIASRIGINSDDYAEIVSQIQSNLSIQVDQYQEQLKSVEEFRSKLKDIAEKIHRKTQKPLVVLIDELDRCRPNYAVEFLEVVKHLIGVKHIVYAFAMNRSELAHTVTGCYGPQFDGNGYLRRFFDIDFTLPYPSRKSFIGFLVEEHFKSLIPELQVREILKRLLTAFLNIETISLRQIQQALNRFRLVLIFVEQDFPDTPRYKVNVIEFCVALILYLYDPKFLRKFIQGELSDKDIVENSVSSIIRGNMDLFDERLWFETIVIRAAQEIAGKNQSTGKYYDTPLLQLYSNKLAQSTSDSYDPSSEEYFAKKLMDEFQDQTGISNYNRHNGHIYRRFKFTVKQLEMLEPLIN
ncbi:MAG: P-loop NTPase fold protein [Bacteroidetes bacterium]|nr:P-loop NTPase fold protein [Bacteroidota bacterium]